MKNNNKKLALIKWFGGKHYILKYLLPFPKHKTYIELFGGGANVLLNKIPSKIEVFNDISEGLINFWLIFRDYFLYFRLLSYCLPQSSTIFDNFLKQNYEGIIPASIKPVLEKQEIDIESLRRAIDFYYRNCYSFSGNNISFAGIDISGHSRRNGKYPSRLEAQGFLEKIWNRIRDVQFLCRNYKELIPLSDRKGNLMYLDPPYVEGGENYKKYSTNNKIWEEEDYKELGELLKTIEKANFILSIDTIEYFNNSRWFIEEVNIVERNSRAKKRKMRKEYIIRNFNNKTIIKQTNERSLLDYGFNKDE